MSRTGIDHRREGIAQLVRKRRKEFVLVLVREAQPGLGVAALLRFLLECAIRLLERCRALSNLREHRVERVDRHAHLVVRRAARAQRKVAPLDHLTGNLSARRPPCPVTPPASQNDISRATSRLTSITDKRIAR